MIFRQATPEDAKKLITLTHTAFLRYSREVGKSVKGVSETYDDILYDIENKYVLLAFEDNELRGAVRMEHIENIVYISRLCASSKNKDINLGEILLDKAKSLAKADAICLHTSTKISSLVMFYYKCGFYIESVSYSKGYPRGLFVYEITENNKKIDYQELTKNK